ncbi:MAG TPA: TPM domain-containing protein [Burkholderiales bacterium]|nr:TPM domain-containing protein [Burkholderiales bacterium]
MNLGRIARHLFTLHGAVARALPPKAMAAIEQAIAKAELQHRGEIRFAAEAALEGAPLLAGQSARERAVEVFSLLRVWDTEENNGVLIYLLLADRDFEIVADRGINANVSSAEWEQICRRMESHLSNGQFEQGIVAGIAEVSRLLARYYPPRPGDRNELPDKPAIL